MPVNENEKIVTLKILSLRDKEKFFVPSYQRGYRWTEFEVRALLDDIWEFDTQNGALEYCLQPLIVRRQGDSFEVVDGQQRLTTLFIFMRIIQEKDDEEKPLFSIEYETRRDSAAFLNGLSEKTCDDESNIDYHFMGSVYKAIKKWISDKVEIGEGTASNVRNRLYDKMINNVFVIWYELPQNSDPIEMFSKVNAGKIPLTDSELIKALLLNRDNFDANEADKRQTEISVSWERIERELNNDSLWYFLKNTGNRIFETRIDLIFDLLAAEYKTDFALDIQESQPHFSFLVLNSVLKQSGAHGKGVMEIWKDAEKKYEMLRSWYEDFDLYHLIGYLLAQGKRISEIQKLIGKSGKKRALTDLIDEIKNEFPGDKKFPQNIDTLIFGKDSKQIRRVLLLFNIAVHVCESDRQTRFPFDIFKKEKWDIEHIHATADDADDPDDMLKNLTLLNADVNRSYKDAPFSEKRKVIIARERAGKFIPICTKNVFLKYYSEEVSDFDLWSEDDKAAYIEKMKSALEDLFGGSWINTKKGEDTL